jgi:hypothetical protein
MKTLSNLKSTRMGLSFEYKTMPICYLVQKLFMFRHNFEFCLLKMSLKDVLKSGKQRFECLKFLNVPFKLNNVVPCVRPCFVDSKL